MTIEKLITHNFKTFLDLEIDLLPTQNKPIILIGGANGGGKTTFFEAINGALYGLNIKKESEFQERVNVGNQQPLSKQEIHLVIHFHTDQQQYIIRRKYVLHEGTVREYYELTIGNQRYESGPHLPQKTRIEAELQFNKVIQACLPKALSHYFLFDAMEASYLLKQEQLELVMKDNIEKVMGFDRFIQLEKTTNELINRIRLKQSIDETKEKKLQKYFSKKQSLKEELEGFKKQLIEKQAFANQHKARYNKLLNSKNEQEEVQIKISYLINTIARIDAREKSYLEQCEQSIKQLDTYVGLPHLYQSLEENIQPILSTYEGIISWTPERLTPIIEAVVKFLQKQQLLSKPVEEATIINHISSISTDAPENLFTTAELQAFRRLTLLPKDHPFDKLQKEKKILVAALPTRTTSQEQLTHYQTLSPYKDSSLLIEYKRNAIEIEELRKTIKQIETNLINLNRELANLDKDIHGNLKQRQDQLKKLKRFFAQFANQLLSKQKTKMEEAMKRQLNEMLIAYKGMIDKVELPSDLKNLIFKIYHKNGNEIFLNQLNTASKQIIIQCLLKTLHTHGKYHPPVIIDTVMGVLDVASRSTMLDSFLPQLAHQTILLSSDSEIRPKVDFDLLAPYLSKTYTFKRDKVKQQTTCLEGYFTTS